MGKKKILLLEDNHCLRELLAGVLEEEEYEVVAVENGLEGIKKCDSSFHILITDRQMPGMLGEEVIYRIKQLYPKIRAVLMTGNDLDDSVKYAIKAAGAEAILTKSEGLVEKIKDVLHQFLEEKS